MTTWIFQGLLASTLLMAGVLATRGLFARHLGPRAAYALWAVPLSRMLVPAIPVWLAPHMWHGGFSALATAFQQEAASYLPWPNTFLKVWLGGALLCFAWQMLTYRRFLRAAYSSAASLFTEGNVEILTSKAVSGPVAACILHPRIFLPANFRTRYAPSEIRLALLHEHAHHSRHDIAANLCALMMLSLQWWNPIAYLAYRAFRMDQELACDATVLDDIGDADRHAYGSAMLKSAIYRVPGLACALSQKDELKVRLSFVRDASVPRQRIWAYPATIAAIVAGLLTTTCRQRDMEASNVAAIAGRMHGFAQLTQPAKPHLEFAAQANTKRHVRLTRSCNGKRANESSSLLISATYSRSCGRIVGAPLPQLLTDFQARSYFDL